MFSCASLAEDCLSGEITSTNGSDLVTIPINAGLFAVDIQQVTSACVNANEELVTVNGVIQVGLEPIPAGTFDIVYFEDTNGNNLIDDGDSQLGVFEVNGPIEANTSFTLLTFS